MNVLPDTSVWSLLLRRRLPAGTPEAPAAARLRALIEGEDRVALAGIVYQEVLTGFRSETARRKLVAYFAPFPLLRAGRSVHERAARLRDACLVRGVGVSAVDVLIAALAIEHACAVLTTDTDFAAIAKHSELRVL